MCFDIEKEKCTFWICCKVDGGAKRNSPSTLLKFDIWTVREILHEEFGSEHGHIAARNISLYKSLQGITASVAQRMAYKRETTRYNCLCSSLPICIMNEVELNPVQYIGSPLVCEVQLPLVLLLKPNRPPVLPLPDGFPATSQVSYAVRVHTEHSCSSVGGKKSFRENSLSLVPIPPSKRIPSRSCLFSVFSVLSSMIFLFSSSIFSTKLLSLR